MQLIPELIWYCWVGLSRLWRVRLTDYRGHVVPTRTMAADFDVAHMQRVCIGTWLRRQLNLVTGCVIVQSNYCTQSVDTFHLPPSLMPVPEENSDDGSRHTLAFELCDPRHNNVVSSCSKVPLDLFPCQLTLLVHSAYVSQV